MKFSVYTRDLLDALKPVVKCAAIKPMTPILTAVKITADDRNITFEATDHNVAASSKIPANVETDGAVCVNARYLLEVVNKLPGEVTTFFAAEKFLEVTSEGSTFDLLIFNVQDFPTPRFPTEPMIPVSKMLFKEMLSKTLFAVAKDEDRPVFKGVNLATKKTPEGAKVIQALATDTKRIAAFLGCYVRGDDTPDFNIVVPVNPLRTILAELDDDPECPVYLIPGEHFLAVKFNNFCFKTRLIDGEFPPTDKVIFFDTQGQATFFTKEFKSVIDRAKVVAKQSDYKVVILKISEDTITVTAENETCGRFSQTVEATCNGEIIIGFNFDYLSDFLNAVGTTKVNLRFNEKYDSIKMIGVGDEDYLYVVTPVRL